jgi:hypothetical protein
VAPLHRAREIEIAAQQRRRIRHRAHHRPRLAAALDELVEELPRLALSVIHRDRVDPRHGELLPELAEHGVGGEIKNKLGPDDFFGEIGVLEEQRVRAATVTATSPMKLVVITGHELRALSRDMPQVVEKLRSACYDRVSGGGS